MSTSTPTDTVVAIGQINLTGNVTPASWWRHITLPSGRPDQTAIALLAEIVYWYRPSEVRDEITGALVGYRKRFHGDKLQRSYQAFADQFGFSKREATDALKRLRDAGFITLELRTVQRSDGMTLSNVLFVEPVPEAINDINSMTRKSDAKNVTPVPFERNTPSVSTEPLPHPDVSDPTLKRETYTENTTEITTEIKNTIGASADAPAPTRSAKQDYSPEFETAWQAYPKRAGGNPKPSAFKAWKARLREGVTPETLLEGVKRYAAYVRVTGSTGTQFVKQAATFFGPDRHFEESWQTPSAPGGGRRNALPVSGFSEQDYGESGCQW
ncbi:replication protein [Salmonella enterica subsp. enterica serovar Newport]|uniref:Replication protein n=1 Tax=Salmonella newport TaxID=108619 RepID=A0A5U9KY23_SALNE|nr:replication protein [Salmonella enterica subsp. enterica serovar Newport]EBW8393172.1 replication protein [Salmonella enterica subsp. enterica serovar Florida]ECR4177955.1 replication protein [Salmonella enterica]ECN8542768.1 replication protein [Salmonella enterica subsp. enterica serovar Newport]EDZ0945734.1 replication protein [Salmonella enterica]